MDRLQHYHTCVTQPLGQQQMQHLCSLASKQLQEEHAAQRPKCSPLDALCKHVGGQAAPGAQQVGPTGPGQLRLAGHAAAQPLHAWRPSSLGHATPHACAHGCWQTQRSCVVVDILVGRIQRISPEAQMPLSAWSTQMVTCLLVHLLSPGQLGRKKCWQTAVTVTGLCQNR